MDCFDNNFENNLWNWSIMAQMDCNEFFWPGYHVLPPQGKITGNSE